ncbi:hypothetical protein [Marinoscillum sp. 108]|uniref:hypothetical protein n=1 Tax=Marinoscillum sp. 108 TaxID=2653151 RepID=UPI00135BEF59|nr:hypothetical protein [Marinoscillum sp. 108]
MKRLIALGFLTLFLLYHIGYLGYYWYSMKQINEEWLVRVDVTPDMKHISIPITLPYWSDQSEYRPSHGSITINGKQYRTVLEKYSQDAIHLIVAEDYAVQELNQSISDWIKMMNTSDSEHSGKVNLLKSIAKDYLADTHDLLPEKLFKLTETSFFSTSDMLTECYSTITTPPPQV